MKFSPNFNPDIIIWESFFSEFKETEDARTNYLFEAVQKCIQKQTNVKILVVSGCSRPYPLELVQRLKDNFQTVNFIFPKYQESEDHLANRSLMAKNLIKEGILKTA